MIVGALAALATGFFIWSRRSSLPSFPNLIGSSPSPKPVPVQPANPLPPENTTPTYSVRQINGCNGVSIGANFRRAPTLRSSAILGVVGRGQVVQVTQQVTRAEGITWYLVVNPSPLHPSLEPAAQNSTDALQSGWMAECFLR